jgi:hypothetical protein
LSSFSFFVHKENASHRNLPHEYLDYEFFPGMIEAKLVRPRAKERHIMNHQTHRSCNEAGSLANRCAESIGSILSMINDCHQMENHPSPPSSA